MADERHDDSLNNQLLGTMRAALKVERDYLISIGAPAERLPKHVAEAVATSVLLGSLPLADSRRLLEIVSFNRILKGGQK